MSSILRCVECPYFTSVKSNLTRHIKLKHDEEKTLYDCPYCQQRFATIDGCKVHMSRRCKKSPEVTPIVSEMANVYNNTQNVTIIVNSDDSNHPSDVCESNVIKKHTCGVCNKAFTRRESLKYHTNICKGIVNILACPVCDKVFASASSKSSHLAKCRVRTVAAELADIRDIKALEQQLRIILDKYAAIINK